jgi:3-ketosteroid 9alpha-monooxygenase subunit A
MLDEAVLTLPPSRFPLPPVPDGWFAVAWADAVPRGEGVPLRAFGRDLVAFRDGEGLPRVLDAHCPHLGAHLGHGGTVVDGHIRCPFHGWTFDGRGTCTKAVGAKRVPKGSAQRSWPTRELHGRIFVWHHDAGEPPQWELPELLAAPGLRWGTGTRIERTIDSHVQDVAENAVDPLHFQYVHRQNEIVSTSTRFDGHHLVTELETTSDLQRLAGIPGVPLKGEIRVDLYGFGLQTIFTRVVEPRTGFAVDTLVVEALVPVEPGVVRLDVEVFLARLRLPGASRLMRRTFARAVAEDVDGDIRVWANRRFLQAPRLTAGDGPIGRYRTWARRFYTSSDPQTATA